MADIPPVAAGAGYGAIILALVTGLFAWLKNSSTPSGELFKTLQEELRRHAARIETLEKEREALLHRVAELEAEVRRLEEGRSSG